MTPAERAQLIDKQEFEAESKALRERAYARIAEVKNNPSLFKTNSEAARKSIARGYEPPLIGYAGNSTRFKPLNPVESHIVTTLNKLARKEVSAPKEIIRRKRRETQFEYNGHMISFDELCKLSPLTRKQLYFRIYNGMEIERALTVPLKIYTKQKTTTGGTSQPVEAHQNRRIKERINSSENNFSIEGVTN